MATLVHTVTGQWKAVVRRNGWPTVSKTFRTKRDAQDWARQVEDEMVRGVFVNRASSHRLSLNHALDRYLAEVTPVKRASTADREQRRAKILKERLGSYSLVSLTPEIISRYRDARIAESKSNNSVRLELALLSHLYSVALKEWRLGLVHNPLLLVRKPSPGGGRDRRLCKGEEQRLLDECTKHSNPMLGWIVHIALHTGMRLGEIVTMRRDQVDLNRRLVHLTATKNGSSRTVPLSKFAAGVLKCALDHPIRPIDCDLIFFGEPGKAGKRGPYEFRPAWYEAKTRAQIHGLRFHDLRHEAVSRLVESGLGDQEVAAISGHKSMQMLKRYTHLRAEDLVSKLDELSENSESTG